MPSDEETLQVTPADNWQGAGVVGNVIKLPSGNNVRCIRSMDLVDLLKAGRIPNPLGAIVQSMVNVGPQGVAPSDLPPEAIMEMLKLVDETVIKCVTEPKVQSPPDPEEGEDADTYLARIRNWKPDAGNLSLSSLTIEDRMYIFVYAQGFAGDLANFREQTTETLARISDGKPVPKSTKRTSGRKR